MQKPALSLLLLSACFLGNTLALPTTEPFDYVSAQNVTGLYAGSGWAGAWTQDGLTGTIRSAGLTWSDAAGRILQTSGLSMTTAGTVTTRNFRILSTTAITDCWISFLWHLPASNALFEGVSFYTGTTAKFTVSNPANTTGSLLYLGVGGSGNIAAGAGIFATTHFVVLRLRDNAGTGGADMVEMFLDPSLAATPTTPTASIQSADLSFSSIRIAGQNGAVLFTDELRFGSNFPEVAPTVAVPNPDLDGDGISNTDEVLLGTDPNVSNLALFDAIKLHPEYLGLYTSTSILQAEAGSVILQKSAVATDPVPLFFELQSSPDLSNWQPTETIHRDFLLPAGKNYLRVNIAK